MDKIDILVRKAATEYYDDCTTEKEVLKAIISEHGKEGLRGYRISDWADDIGELEHIEKIDDFGIYYSDIDAAKQAAKDGVKLIPYSEQPKKLPYRYYRFLDTPLNRHRLSKIGE